MERVAQVPVAISLVVQGIVIISLILVRSPIVTRLLVERFTRIVPRRGNGTNATGEEGRA
jgi:hypothetical protein